MLPALLLRRTGFGRLAGLFVLAAFTGSTGCTRTREDCGIHFRKRSELSIRLPSVDVRLGEVFPLDYDSDGYPDFLAAEINLKNRDHPERLRLFHNEKGRGYREVTAEILGRQDVFHARYMETLDASGDGSQDYLIADHGPDVPPFPGAHPVLLMNHGGKKLVNETAERLPSKPAFTFHATAWRNPESKRQDIYLSNLTNETSRPQFFSNHGAGYFKDESWRLPKDLRGSSLCFMSSHALKIEGVNTLVLGSCDRDRARPQPDRALQVRRGKFEWLPESYLPSRQGDPSWGTASIRSIDLVGNGLEDLILATHNVGFTSGKVEILIQDRDRKGKAVFRAPKSPLPDQSEAAPSFIAWTQAAVLRTGHSPDILFALRDTPQPGRPMLQDHVRLWLNQGQEGFKDHTACLPLSLRKRGGHVFLLDLNHEGKTGILSVGYDGTVESYFQ